MTNAIHRHWKFDAPILALAVNRNGDWVAASLGDGSARLFHASDAASEPKPMQLHDGISLSLQADADAHGFLSGGDDGKILVIDPEPATATLIAEHKNQWVDHVAGGANGKHRAYSIGKKLYVLDDSGKSKFTEPLMLPSSPGGLRFSPNGKRLAASHYNGVSLWWMNALAVAVATDAQGAVGAEQSRKNKSATTLNWKGSHLDLIWSPDGKILLTSLQENALHGWQLSDGKEMRMQGYAAKVRSMAFTLRGKYLATAGADQIICWPFVGGGPWGKPPVTLGGTDVRLVTQVAPHPKDDMIAAGYDDGMVVLAPLDGRMEIMIAPPLSGQKNAIIGLVWNLDGDALYAATESGTVMLFTVDSVRKAVVQSNAYSS